VNKKNIISLIITISFLLAVPIACFSQQGETSLRRLIIFYSPSCHQCIRIKNELMPNIEKEFHDKILIEYRNINDIENYKYLLALREKYKTDIEIKVPLFYFEGKFLKGEGEVGDNLHRLIIDSLGSHYIEGELPKVDLVNFFKRFNLWGVTIAGLEDGINPCAFTVIVFFISYLALQGYKKRELVVIGLSFISTVFVAYFLIGLCIFNFLYALKGYWALTKTINIVIGILSIILGIFAFYDFLKFKKTKDTEGLLLQLPRQVQNRIHSVIGLHYRKTKDKTKEPNIFKLILTAVITGFLVTLLEAVCTGQLYLPTITFIVKTSSLKLKIQALGYLFLYNILFIIPLFIIFLFALLGVTSEQFTRFLKKYLGTIKILMAILFFILGVVLIYFQVPQEISKPKASLGSSVESGVSDKTDETKIKDSFSWDFGEVKEGEVLKHDFLFKNSSANTLNIQDVNTSCGCTVSKIRKKILLPGEATSIEVQFDTKGYSGPTQQFIYVHTDSLDTPIFRFIIKADVQKQ
jgi:cytochrome c biogenesis protein CcdA